MQASTQRNSMKVKETRPNNCIIRC